MHSRWFAEALNWIFSTFLGVVWLSRIAVVWLNRKSVADITAPEYDVSPKTPTLPTEGGMGHPDPHTATPRVTIIVPARNEGEHIEAALLSLLQLDYPDYEVIAIDDRSDDETGVIMERVNSEWRESGEVSRH